MPTKYLHRDGLAIHYEHTGATTLPGIPPSWNRGVALVFVHGGGGNGRLWGRQLAHFTVEHSPLAVDLSAHGRSGGLDAPASVSAAADMLSDVLAALGATPAVLVGHGLGGQVALAMALDHASGVRAVVTIATSAAPPGAAEEATTLRDVVRGRRPQSFDTPWFSAQPDMKIVREVWGEIVKTDPRVRLQDLESYEASDLRPRLAEVAVPTLVLHGAEDRYCAPSSGEEIASMIPGARFESVASAGHFAQIENADRVNALIEGFLR